MKLPEAKETLEAMCLADEVTPELIEASTVILERLESIDKPESVPAPAPKPVTPVEYDDGWGEDDEYDSGCTCSLCRLRRGE